LISAAFAVDITPGFFPLAADASALSARRSFFVGMKPFATVTGGAAGLVESFSLAFWSSARYPLGFDAGAAEAEVVTAEAGFGAGGVAFRGGAAVLVEAMGFFARAFAGFADDGAAVPRYGTVVVVGWPGLAAAGAAVGRAVPVYCKG
jgi:hypothetical protein